MYSTLFREFCLNQFKKKKKMKTKQRDPVGHPTAVHPWELGVLGYNCEQEDLSKCGQKLAPKDSLELTVESGVGDKDTTQTGRTQGWNIFW